MAKFKKLFGEFPEKVHVLTGHVEFDKNGEAEILDEDIAAILRQVPGYEEDQPEDPEDPKDPESPEDLNPEPPEDLNPEPPEDQGPSEDGAPDSGLDTDTEGANSGETTTPRAPLRRRAAPVK